MRVRAFDSDRAVEVRVPAGTVVLVRGARDEPMIRVDGDGARVNAFSPTARADGLVPRGSSGWVQVESGATFAWHDGRVRAPVGGARTASFAIPVDVDGRAATIAGRVVAVPRPALRPWLAAAAVLALGVAAVAWRWRRGRAALTVALATAAGVAALASVTGFAADTGRGGGVPLYPVTAGLVLVLALVGLLAVLRGRSQVVAAGVIGAVTAAVGLSALPVFWHGVVLSALPADAARAAAGLALLCGIAAALLSFLPDFDEERRSVRP